jgi:hypothetical protein
MAEKLPSIFLGFPFTLEYVRPAVEAAAEGVARVVVASDVLRGKPLLHKIQDLMREADLCLFDLTLHNPNVAAEFGIAHGTNYKYAILYCTDERLNPKPGKESSVFSDVKGWDSVQYADAANLMSQLKRYLPELLRAPRPLEPAPLRVRQAPEGDSGIRPRLNAKVSTVFPAAFAVGSGPVIKAGTDMLAFEIDNSGRGVANKVRIAVTGMDPIERFEALPTGTKNGVKFRWNLEAQPAYKSAPQFPALVVEYEDDEGTKYEQRGALNARQSGDGFTYEGQGLGAPRVIEAHSISWP